MPARPVWFHRLDRILEQLRQLAASHLDRLTIEKLFGVRERRARQLMAGLPCLQVGNAVAVERLALIARLENTAGGAPFQWERARRTRVSESLESIRKQSAGERIQLPAAPEVRNRMLRDLTPGIEIRAGELRVRFEGAEDLAAKLFELSQAMSNDWRAFQEMADRADPSK